MSRKKPVFKRQVVAEDGTPEIRMELQAALTYFINAKKAENLKPKTLVDYELNVQFFVNWLHEFYRDDVKFVGDVTTTHIREYAIWCATERRLYDGHPYRRNETDKRLSTASVNTRIGAVKTFYNFLANDGVVTDNPSKKVAFMREDVDTVQPLSDDELKRLITAPDKSSYAQYRDYVILLLMVDTGMRISEICGIEMPEVDVKSRHIVLPGSKTKNRRPRVLPLSPEVAKHVQTLMNESLTYFGDTVQYVFCTNAGERLSPRSVYKYLKRYAQSAGIKSRVTPHVIRHNFAKMAALNGMDIFSLMRLMGHADIATTRRYVQVNDDDVRKQHELYSPITRILRRGRN